MASSLALASASASASSLARRVPATLLSRSPPQLPSAWLGRPALLSSAALSRRGLARLAAARTAGRREGQRRAMATAAIAVGSKIPDAELSYFDKQGDLQTITTGQLTKGKKVVLFAVPGAFTPTCSQKHLPGFIQSADDLKSKGIDTLACVAVNDPFVMRAWGEATGASDKVLMLADGSGTFTKAMGVSLDLTDKGLGIRSRRYALLADNGVVKSLNLEEGGAFTISGPDEILKEL